MFVDFFIKRPVFATVCALLIILAGAVVIPTLPIAQFPILAPPQVSVTSAYIGASAQTVETAVTIPLEEQINGAEGMKYLSSSSTNDGISSITATFNLERDPDLAAVDIQNRVNQAQGRLPNAVKATGITVTKASNDFVFGAAVYSDGRYDTLFMSNYLDVYVRDALKRVPGVADVIIFGERKFSMRLWLDPERMASRALTAPDVVAALQEQNVEVAAGQVGAPPIKSGQNFQISVRAVGRLSEAAQFDNIIVKTNADGTLVRLKDVGRAELGAEDYGSDLMYNGRDSVGIGILQLSNANALEVDRLALVELEKLSKRFPPGMKYENAFDTTEAVGESIYDVLSTLVEAIVLVILVIYIFLEDWRTTIIPAVTIPVSLIGTFAFVKLLGFSINTLTLFGITLATGLVVDDAIVVIENIERHIQEGENDSHKAASVAMKEVAGAVIATSLVLVAVFVPVAFLPRHHRNPVPAVRADHCVLHCDFRLQRADPDARAFRHSSGTPTRQEGLVLPRSGQGLGGITEGYRRSLRGFLRFRLVAVILFLVALGLTYMIFQRVPQGFVPNEDQGYLIISVQSPSGASLEYTKNIEKQIQDVMGKLPEVQGVFAISGFSFAGNASNRGIVFVPLKAYSKRQSPESSADAVLARVRGPLFGINGALVFPFLPPAVQGLGEFGGFQFEVLDQGGHTLDELAVATQGLVRQGNSRKDLTGLFTSYTANDPQFLITIDREKAKSLHVPSARSPIPWACTWVPPM